MLSDKILLMMYKHCFKSPNIEEIRSESLVNQFESRSRCFFRILKPLRLTRSRVVFSWSDSTFELQENTFHVGINHMIFFAYVLNCQRNQLKSKGSDGCSLMTNELTVITLKQNWKKEEKTSLSRTPQRGDLGKN